MEGRGREYVEEGGRGRVATSGTWVSPEGWEWGDSHCHPTWLDLSLSLLCCAVLFSHPKKRLWRDPSCQLDTVGPFLIQLPRVPFSLHYHFPPIFSSLSTPLPIPPFLFHFLFFSLFTIIYFTFSPSSFSIFSITLDLFFKKLKSHLHTSYMDKILLYSYFYIYIYIYYFKIILYICMIFSFSS